jgi:hypothetical protein
MNDLSLLLDEEDTRAVAVLATATMHVVGRDAPVVASLRQLLRDRSHTSYEAAARRFDGLGPDIRQRIAASAPTVARRKLKGPNLPGLLGVLNRR